MIRGRIALILLPVLLTARSPASAIHDAVRRRDFREVQRQLLINPASLNEQEPKEQRTPLHIAATDKNDYRIAEFLLQKGADQTIKDKYGNLPIHVAAWYGFMPTINLFTQDRFLPRGGLPTLLSARDYFSGTPLGEAVAMHRREATQFLLLKGSDPNFRYETDGSTLLMHAVKSGVIELTQFLLTGGADPNARDNRGRTALFYTAEKNNAGAVLQLLRYGANPNASALDGSTPLHALQGCMESILFLMRAGADPNVADNVGETPLHLAVRTHSFPTAFALLSGRPLEPAWHAFGDGDQYAVNTSGHFWDDASAMTEAYGAHLATIRSKAENDFVDQLARQATGNEDCWIGAFQPMGSPEPAGGWQYVSGEPLTYANWGPGEPNNAGDDESRAEIWRGGVWNDSSSDNHFTNFVMQRPPASLIPVIAGVADPGVLDGEGYTALQRAVLQRDFTTASLLLAYGADPTQKSKKGEDALGLAESLGDPLLTQALQKSTNRQPLSPDDFKAALQATKDNDAKELRTLLAKHPQLATERGAGLWTLLHRASFYGAGEAVQFLLEAGSHLTSTEAHGYTALHLAAQEGREHVIEVLIEHGANLAATDDEGWTPLHLAAYENKPLAVKKLLSLGAKASVRTAKGWTALDLARYGHADAAAKVLADAG